MFSFNYSEDNFEDESPNKQISDNWSNYPSYFENPIEIYKLQRHRRNDLSFELNVDKCLQLRSEHINRLMDDLKLVKNNEYFLPYHRWDYEYRRNNYGKETKIFYIEVTEPETQKTVANYHSVNENIIYNEKCYHLINLIEIYDNAITLNHPLQVSFGDMSIVLVRNDQYPYPQMALSPYAYMLALKKKYYDNEEVTIHKAFADIFNDMFHYVFHESTYTQYQQEFDQIIQTLQRNESAIELLRNNKLIKEIKESFKLPEFSLSDYEYVDDIAKGSFGSVVKVKHRQTNEIFCIKESKVSMKCEALVLNQLNNPFIVKIFGYIISSERLSKNKSLRLDGKEHHFLLMEYCEYGTLDDYINEIYQSDEYLTYDQLKLIFGQIAIAQKYLHFEMNFIHRDIKLGNILIYRNNPIIIKFADFGFARSIDSLMISNVGTPITLDVRILSGKPYDATSDLHSIGSVLYCLLHNRYPTEMCQSEVEIIELYENNGVHFDKYLLHDKQFSVVVDLCNQLLNPAGKDVCFTWKMFFENSFVIDAMKYVDTILNKK